MKQNFSSNQRMDLLRLTLSRLPLTRLINLKALIRSNAFLRIRMEVVNSTPVTFPRDRMENYLRHCTLEGELWQKAFLYVNLEMLRYRAVFLRYPAGFRQFRDYRKIDYGFWRYLETDNLEIRARALTQLYVYWKKGSSGVVPILSSYRELYLVNWTVQLRKFLALIVGEEMGESAGRIHLSELAGFLRIPVADNIPFADNYLTGYLTSFTGGDTVETKIPECEAVIRRFLPHIRGEDIYLSFAKSGYIIPDHFMGKSSPKNLKLGYLYARLPLIKMNIMFQDPDKGISYFDFAFSRIITKNFVLRVREILADPIYSKLPAGVLRTYHIIAGDRTNFMTESIGVLVGDRPIFYEIPPRFRELDVGFDINQSAVVYDPVFSAHEASRGLGPRVAYMRGLGLFVEKVIPPEDWEDVEKLRNPEIAKILKVGNSPDLEVYEGAYTAVLSLLREPASPGK